MFHVKPPSDYLELGPQDFRANSSPGVAETGGRLPRAARVLVSVLNAATESPAAEVQESFADKWGNGGHRPMLTDGPSGNSHGCRSRAMPIG